MAIWRTYGAAFESAHCAILVIAETVAIAIRQASYIFIAAITFDSTQKFTEGNFTFATNYEINSWHLGIRVRRKARIIATYNYARHWSERANQIHDLPCSLSLKRHYRQPDYIGFELTHEPFDSFAQLRGSQALRLQMIGKGRARASAYSWRATALRYLKAMAAADGVDAEAKIVRAREFT